MPVQETKDLEVEENSLDFRILTNTTTYLWREVKDVVNLLGPTSYIAMYVFFYSRSSADGMAHPHKKQFQKKKIENKRKIRRKDKILT